MATQSTTIRVNTAYLHMVLGPVYREAMLGEHEAELALLDLGQAAHRQLYVEEIIVPLFDELAPAPREQARQALKYLLHVLPGPQLDLFCQIFGVELAECVPLLNQIWSVVFPEEDRNVAPGWRFAATARPLNYHQTKDFYATSPRFLEGAWARLEQRLYAALESKE